MDAGQLATDDGSRTALHFLSTSLKIPVLARFEGAVAVNPGLDKQAAEAAGAYLQDLTVSRSAFISKLDSSAANTDAELDVAVSSYLSLLLGLVNSYAAADTTAGLDQETGESSKLSVRHITIPWSLTHDQKHLQMQGCKLYWEQAQRRSVLATSVQLSANKCWAMHQAGTVLRFSGKMS